METTKPFKSERAIDAEVKRYRVAAFDKMIDLALDGIVTMPEAIQAFKEQDLVENPPADTL